MGRRSGKKSKYAKLRAKANKAVAKAAKRATKGIKRATRRVERKLASNTLARTGRKTAKRATKATKKAVKRARKTAKQTRKRIKSFVSNLKKANRDRNRRRKKAAAQARKDQRAREREFNRLTLSGDADISGAMTGGFLEGSGSSKPGEPPKMRTGKGRKSITAELRMKGKKPQARTYVDKKVAGYMAMWEFRQDGKARPFLKPSVENNLNMFGQEIGNSLKQQLRPQAGKKKATVR